MNETLEVKWDGYCLSDEEGTEEIINEVLFGVRQRVEVVMGKNKNGNAEEIFQASKEMYLFNEISDKILQCDGIETGTTQEDFQKKDEAGNEGCDEVLKRFHLEINFLEQWLKEPNGEVKLAKPDLEEITVTMHDRDEMFMQQNKCYKFSDNYVSVCTESYINRFDVEVREVEQN